MYNDEQINEMFKNKIPQDEKSQSFFKAYVNIYKQSFTNPRDYDKFHHHHFYPSFLYKTDLNEKNRYHCIEKLDENYNPQDNVCKLRIMYHVIAHYYLAMSLRDTQFALDSRNAFFVLIGDYSKDLESYTIEEVKKLGRLVEENNELNKIDHYMTKSETKEYLKQKQKEYKEKWNKEHKEEIEERKRKQKEYAKQKREEYKNYLKNKK